MFGDIVEGHLDESKKWLEVSVSGGLRYIEVLGSEGNAVLSKSKSINRPFSQANCIKEFGAHVPWCVSNCGRMKEFHDANAW